MARVFIAASAEGLGENPELRRLVVKLKRTLKEREIESRWVSPEFWHVTLQFLGDVEGERLELLKNTLREFSRSCRRELSLQFKGLGAFPSEREARVLWVGVHRDKAWLELQTDLGTRLSEVGFASDEREHVPHLTLARFRQTASVTDLIGLGGRKSFGSVPVRELILYQSVLQGKMPKYIPLLKLPLTS